MEYLIGDGPQNRFALICAECQSHNGMALREEFEYIGKLREPSNILTCHLYAFNVTYLPMISRDDLNNDVLMFTLMYIVMFTMLRVFARLW